MFQNLRVFGGVFIVYCIAVTGGGCGVTRVTSVVSPEESSGLQTLSTWKAQADVAVKDTANTDKTKYEDTRHAVDATIDTFKRNADTAATSWFNGTADLSDDAIPQRTKDLVKDALARRGGIHGGDIAKWLQEQVDAARKQSAENVKVELEKWKWTPYP